MQCQDAFVQTIDTSILPALYIVNAPLPMIDPLLWAKELKKTCIRSPMWR